MGKENQGEEGRSWGEEGGDRDSVTVASRLFPKRVP